ncbi:isoprenyl transferase [Kallotenue papyrolyticum]|uniref:isoprenyl transferase n=1 Tax=Kallotenue papyrolyticum TaxID=1325125 RepID=UPI0004929C65|nr:isoprenyl transferase [Kallotenue papyrolyticum]
MSAIPQHIAIIMDGNGRWAQQRGLPRAMGHRAGTENIRRIVQEAKALGVRYLTLYAFSTENWNRPGPEVRALMAILGEFIDRETAALHAEGVQIRHLGSLDGLSPQLQAKVRYALELTRHNTALVLAVAFNYGGRADIVQAVRAIVREGIPPEAITEAVIADHLYTRGMPDPDLIVRTAGEFRLSNFLIWQAAYAEYYSTPVFWPDFGPEDLKQAVAAYGQRERRFGALPQAARQ